MIALNTREKDLRDQAKELIRKADKNAETNDKDYVFLYFILNFLPKGLIGLLLAVIISAAMSSSASGLNALASTTTIDIYKRHSKGGKIRKTFCRCYQNIYTYLGYYCNIICLYRFII